METKDAKLEVYEAKLGNLLVVGTTGSGMSNFTDLYLTSLASRYTSDDLQLILVDPKKVQLSQYKDLPHVIEVVHDIEQFRKVLAWIEVESERRLKLKEGVPVVLLIEETADFLVADKELVESSIKKITQRSQETGIYVFLATARGDMLSQNLIDCFQKRIAFRVGTGDLSLLVLGQKGAENLTQPGSCLVKESGGKVMIAQMPRVSEKSIASIAGRHGRA